jgi:hypothetical protein
MQHTCVCALVSTLLIGCGSVADPQKVEASGQPSASSPSLRPALPSTHASTAVESLAPSLTGDKAVGAIAIQPHPTKLPLLQQAGVSHRGAFAPPPDARWSGKSMAAYRDESTGKVSLYYRGHDQSPDSVAQITVPESFSKSPRFAELPLSAYIKPWSRVTNGELDKQVSSLGDHAGNGSFIYGMLPFNGRLVISGTTYYSRNQEASHGIVSLDLAPSSFRGFFRLSGESSTFPRAMGGAMTEIPAPWQPLLGGKAIVGNAQVSIISANSFGPAMTVFDPDDVGRSLSPKAETLVFYPAEKPLCGALQCEQSLNPLFTWASTYNGRAFVPGTRTILAIGVHPYGEMWYGGPVSPKGTRAFCDDGGWGQKAAGMEARILAFDANDLLAVKARRRQPNEVRPYAIWRLPEIESNRCWDIQSSAFEPVSGLLFIAVRRFDEYGPQAFNRIEVFQVEVGK